MHYSWATFRRRWHDVLLSAAAAITLLVLSSSFMVPPAHAQIGAPIILQECGDVTLTVQASNTDLTSVFWSAFGGSLGVTNEQVGQPIHLGEVPAGELILGIHVNGTGYTFWTGSGVNPDGIPHAFYDGHTVGFEDSYGGGDLDYDDAVVSISFAPCSPAAPSAAISPEHGPAGTPFGVEWAGFTPSSTLTAHFRNPDGSELLTATFDSDATGAANYVVDSVCLDVGTYAHWAVDDTTGATTSTVTFSVDENRFACSFSYPMENWEALKGDLGFGWLDNGGNLHLGQDTNIDLETGTPFYAAANGVVRLSDERAYRRYGSTSPKSAVCSDSAYRGYLLVLEHTLPDGSKATTLYGHVQPGSEFYDAELEAGLAPVGRQVQGGDYLGHLEDYWHVENRGACDTAENWHHLHFGLRSGQFDPRKPVGTYVAGYGAQRLVGFDDGQWRDPHLSLILAPSLSPGSVPLGGDASFEYSTNSALSAPLSVRLGAQIRLDEDSDWIDDPINDRVVSLAPGTGDYSRRFSVDPSLEPGLYDAAWVLIDEATGTWLDRVEVPDAIEVVPIPPGFSCSRVTQIPLVECEALVAFSNSTDVAEIGWLSTETPCDWYGVTCAEGHVMRLELQGLSGSIAPELGDLTALEYLYIYNHGLSGSIPPELGNLSALTALHLGDGQLSGSIPPELGNLTALVTLDLYANLLTGNIPPELGNLTALTYLYLPSNQLSGSIPPELGNLTALQGLNLNNNQLSGSIPLELGNLTALTYLYLPSNQLSGSIPPELGNLTSLESLNLSHNQLSGPLPQELTNLSLSVFRFQDTDLCEPADVAFQTWLDGIPNLTSTGVLCDTEFSCASVSQIPFVECEALVALSDSTDVSKMGWLSTQTPCDWYGVTCSGGHVTTLRLPSIDLSGSIPPELGNLSALTILTLYSNQLSGTIPPELGNLTVLRYLGLSGNQLSGTIPPELGNLSALESLALFGNRLSGSIPAELGDLAALRNLLLDDNQLNGSIPPELGDLSALQNLYLADNQLSGSIPSELGNLTALDTLQLSDNQLNGSIPAELGNLTVLRYLQLRNNQLSGSIPAELGNLTALRVLDLTTNQLSGSIPAELGSLVLLEYLSLHGNQLGGDVPPELGNLVSLQYFYLSYNPLSGPLPDSLNNLSPSAFWFDSTDLCEPGDAAFQTWLWGISDLRRTSVLCP